MSEFQNSGPILEKILLVAKFKLLVNLLWLRKRAHAALCGSPGRDKLMVNVGGALFFRPGWKVLDHTSPFYPFNPRYIEYDVDLMRTDARFPFADGAVDFFYSAHTFEHIPQEFCQNILNEMHRTLKPGGAVRLNMPDYDRMRAAVAAGDADYFHSIVPGDYSPEEGIVEQIATERWDKVPLEEIRRDYARLSPEDFADRYTAAASREVQKEKGGWHINWFNYAKLERMLRAAGFATIYRSAPQRSRFAELRGEGGRLTVGDFFEIKRMLGLDATHPDKSLYVEAVK